jgi:putative transcriptional regulator
MEATRLTDHFIIAMPDLLDPNFDHTVTYICEHDENGSFGIVINREIDVTLEDIMQQMQIQTGDSTKHKRNIFHGGPVQEGRGFVLHRPLGSWSSTLQINTHVALTSSRDIIEAIANDQGPKDSIIALGYAGWAPGQLEQELAANSWLSCPANEQIIFEIPPEDRWQAAADIIGVDLQLLSHDAGHA